MPTRPTTSPLWCHQNPTARVEPSSSVRATGFSPGEVLASQTLNSLFGTLGDYCAYLDAQGTGTVLASSLDFSTRLIGGGTLSWSSTTLAWSAPLFVAIPSSPDAANTIPAGAVDVPAGSVAYVTANEPFSTTATTTSGSAQLTNVMYGDLVKVGQTASGPGIAAGATVQAVAADGGTVTLNAPATATASGVTVTFASSGTLAVAVAPSASLVPGPNTVVVARAIDDACIVGVGSGQMLLRPGEAKRLLGHGFASSRTVTAGAVLGARVPVYISPGATDAGRSPGRAYPLDASAASNSTRATLAGITATAAASGGTTTLVGAGVVTGFSGLTAGSAYFATGVGALGLGPTTTSGEWVVPAGIAVSNTELLVAAGGPPAQVGANATVGNLTANGTSTFKGPVTGVSFVSQTGFKSVVPAGTFAFTQTVSGTSYPTYLATVDIGTGATSRVPFQLPFTHSGSVVGVSVRGFSAASAALSVYPLRNGNKVIDGDGRPVALGASTVGNAQRALDRGLASFAPGDVLSAGLEFVQSGNYIVSVSFTIELTGA